LIIIFAIFLKNMDDLYTKILDTLLTLRDTAEHFKIRSAQDIKKLIQAKMAAKTLKEPKDLATLYALEKEIRELREAMEQVKGEQ
jgi:hypothetical protein